MALTYQDIDEYEDAVMEHADKEIAAYRKLLGLSDSEVEPDEAFPDAMGARN